MNRRSFLASMIAVGGSVSLRRSEGQVLSATTMRSSSATEQAGAIRTAADQLLRTLTPDRRNNVLCAFPTGQTPTEARFARSGGMGGGPNGGGGPGRGRGQGGGGGHDDHGRGPQFKPDGGPPGGPPDGGGHGGGPGGGPGGFAFIGEKYGTAVWSNYPVSDVPRPGVRMGAFTPAEREAAHGLLKVVLSPMGYQKVLDIMAADQTLADDGTPYASGLDAYTLALLGQPTATAPWMLQFGGHHLGLNVTFVGDKAVCAPLHTGILPSKFEKGGRTIRGLGRENDKAFDLLATFTSEQLKAATINHGVSDLVFGPGRPNAKLSPEGLLGSEMTEHQRTTLLSLIGEWVGVLNDAHSAGRLDDIRKELPDVRFAWSGPTTHEPGMNGEAYFRAHGPSVLIEHAPQGNQGGYKMHVHTVMRDLTNDYAKRLLV